MVESPADRTNRHSRYWVVERVTAQHLYMQVAGHKVRQEVADHDQPACDARTRRRLRRTVRGAGETPTVDTQQHRWGVVRYPEFRRLCRLCRMVWLPVQEPESRPQGAWDQGRRTELSGAQERQYRGRQRAQVPRGGTPGSLDAAGEVAGSFRAVDAWPAGGLPLLGLQSARSQSAGLLSGSLHTAVPARPRHRTCCDQRGRRDESPVATRHSRATAPRPIGGGQGGIP